MGCQSNSPSSLIEIDKFISVCCMHTRPLVKNSIANEFSSFDSSLSKRGNFHCHDPRMSSVFPYLYCPQNSIEKDRNRRPPNRERVGRAVFGVCGALIVALC